jgi:hypothetical protein
MRSCERFGRVPENYPVGAKQGWLVDLNLVDKTY